MKMSFKTNSYYLAEHVKKNIDLLDFLENNISCDFSRSRSEDHGSCICPMPFHKDSAPSFHVRKNEDDIWIYNCFGCGSSGTVIDFFMDYYDCDNFIEALDEICNVFKIENTNELIIKGLQSVSKKTDVKRKIDNAHILTANICRSLLKKNIEFKPWVLEQYKIMNEALNQEDILIIEEIGYQASKRIRGA